MVELTPILPSVRWVCNAGDAGLNGGSVVRSYCCRQSRVWPTGVPDGQAALAGIAVLLVLGLVGYSVAWGAFIDILLVVALVILMVNVIGGRRTERWY